MACKICEKECPPQCIYIVKSDDKKPDYMGKPQFYPTVFDIDISVCMSCQICVEVCPFEAIKMDKDYELSRRERFDALLMRKDDSRNRTATITRFIPSKPPRLTRIWRSGSRAEAKKKAAAEAAAKAAAAKAAAAATAEAKPAADGTSPSPASS